MEIDYKAIGQRIKIARIKKGITQEKLSEIVELSPSHVSNIETGNSKLGFPALINITNALEVSVDELLCDNLIQSKFIFEKEAQELFHDCTNYETRIMVDTLKAIKESIRKNITIKG